MMPAVTANAHNPWLAQTVRIERIRKEISGVATYDLAFVDHQVAAEYRFQAGQFNMLYLPGLGEIAISISGDPDARGAVPHTIREAGNVTRTLASMSEQSTIGLRGPFGSSWPVEECRGKDVILVAGGIGLAPLRPVICQLLSNRNQFGNITLVIGSRDPLALLYPYEYERWRQCGLDVQVTVDRASETWRGNIGMVTSLLDRLSITRPASTLLMTCGPEVMMWYTIQGAMSRGLNPQSLYVSLERNMNCAIGLCGHCQFGAQFICKDGPVFRYDRVASIMKVDDL